MWKELIDKNLIIIDPDIKSKQDLFENMVNHVYNNDYIINKKEFLIALNKREQMSNTELIKGVAFPHARSNSVFKLFLSIIILKQGLDYDNPQMGPVKIIFFFGCSEDNAKEYLQILAKSSRLLKEKSFRKSLEAVENADQVIEILEKHTDEDEEEEDSPNCLMILTLFDTEKKPEIMSAMVEIGITNATIVEASSLAKKIAYEIPIFAGLSYMSRGKSSSADLIISHLNKKSLAWKLVKLLKKNGIDLNKSGVGYIQLLKVESVIGNYEEDIEI